MFGKEIRKLKWEVYDLKRDVEILKMAVQALQYELEKEGKESEDRKEKGD